jgi:hypothetical protein
MGFFRGRHPSTVHSRRLRRMNPTNRTAVDCSAGCDSARDDSSRSLTIRRIFRVDLQCSLRRPASGSRKAMGRERRRRVHGPRSRSARFLPLSCIRTVAIDSSRRAGRRMDGARADFYVYGVVTDCRDAPCPLGPARIGTFYLRDRQLSGVGNSEIARPGLAVRSRSSRIGTPTLRSVAP